MRFTLFRFEAGQTVRKNSKGSNRFGFIFKIRTHKYWYLSSFGMLGYFILPDSPQICLQTYILACIRVGLWSSWSSNSLFWSLAPITHRQHATDLDPRRRPHRASMFHLRDLPAISRVYCCWLFQHNLGQGRIRTPCRHSNGILQQGFRGYCDSITGQRSTK